MGQLVDDYAYCWQMSAPFTTRWFSASMNLRIDESLLHPGMNLYPDIVQIDSTYRAVSEWSEACMSRGKILAILI